MNKSTILIAGDDGVLASHLQNILSRQGYRIAGPFTSTEEAIAFLSGQPVDLILMDIERESISEGCAFVEQVLSLPDIPIVFLLGLSQSSLLENTGIISRHGHLVKPVQERELTVVIELTLRRFFLDRLLKKSEARYRHLFENSPLGIFRTTLDGRVLSVNPEMARLAGCDSPEEAITKCTNLAEQFYADPNQRREFITLLREKGFVTNFEYKARKKNGEALWISMNARLTHLRELDEQPDEFVIDGFATDITARKFAHEESRRNEARFKGIARILQYKAASIQEFLDNALNEAILLTESRIGYIYFYDEDRREFVLNSWSKEAMKECRIVSPQTCYAADKTGLWGEAVRQRKPVILNDFQIDHPLKKGYPPGHVHLDRFMTVPVFKENKIVAVAGVANKSSDYDEADVLQLTLLMDAVWKSIDQKKGEEALHQANAILRAAMDKSPAGIVVADAPDGRLRYVNDAGLLILGDNRPFMVAGVERNQYIFNWRFLDLDGRLLEKEQEPLARALLFGATNNLECMIPDKTVADRVALVSAVPITDQNGRIAAGVAVFSDITARKQNEEKLQASEGKFRSLAESSKDCIMRFDQQCRHTYVNPAGLNIGGLKEEDIIGRTHRQCGFPEDLCVFWEEKIKQVFATGEACQAEFTWNNSRGTVYLDLRMAPEFDQEGRVFSVLGISRDITNRKRLENVQTFLARTTAGTSDAPFFNSLCRYLADNLDMDFVCISQMDGMNAPFRTVAVWREGRFEHNTSCPLHDTLCGEAADKPVCCHSAGIRRVFPENKLLEELAAESYAAVTLRRHNGQPIGVIAVIGRKPLVNCSFAETLLQIVAGRAAGEFERQEAEEALRRSEAQYRRIVDTAREGVWCFDKNWQTVFVNPHMAAMLGYEPDEILGRAYADFIHEDDLADHARQRQERQQGKGCQYERRFRSKTGGVVWAIVSATPLMDDEGRFTGTFGMFTDITARKKVEEEKDKIQTQLIQAQKMESVGRLAGGVAHDFNNMLSVIIGNTELVLAQTKEDSRIFKELEDVKNAALKSADLTRQLLAFARKQAITPKVINLNHAIEGILKMLRRIIGENISMVWLPRAGLHPVFIDPSQIDQILANLCVNSRDAIMGDGEIAIETENITVSEEYCEDNTGFVPGEYVLLSFSDNGCGISKENMKHVFEPFFTTKKRGEGTGLGLAMIYGIVKQNGGFIDLVSEQGKGTTFRIYLPRYEGESIETQQSENLVIPQGHGETILLVEDEMKILELNKKILGKIGYHVLATSSATEAVKLAAQYPGTIRLLMTDIIMPEMNGYDLAKKISEMKPDMKCLFVSGYTANVIDHEGFVSEGVHFLQKPFMRKDLAKKLHEILPG